MGSSSGAALAQMTEIHIALQHLPPLSPARSRVIARDIARAVPELTRSLTESAERQFYGNLWLVRSDDTGRQWALPSDHQDPPIMLQRLKLAADHSTQLTEHVQNFSGVRKTELATPRKLLAQPLADLTPASPLALNALVARSARRPR